MLNQENLKLNIQPELTPEQLKTATKLRTEILEKIAKFDEALRNREALLNSNLRKDEKVEIEADFNQLETQKKVLMGQLPDMAATPQQTPVVTESLILDQYGNPFNQQKPPVVLVDQYSNPLPPSTELPPIVQPVQQPTQAPVQPIVQAPTTAPVPQMPTAPAAPVAKIIPVVAQAPTPSVVNNAPAVPITPVQPAGPAGPTGPTPVATPTKTPEQLLAEKIRRGDPLTREELLFRRDHYHGTGGIAEELEKLATPPDPNEVHTFIEMGGPTLERSRNDYVYELFKNRNSYYPDAATFAHIKTLKEAYNKNIDEQINTIQPVGDMLEDKIACKKLRLKFMQGEREAFQREILRLDNEETRKRVGKAIEKAFDKTGKFLGKAKEKIGQGIDKVRDFFTDDPKTKGMGWLYYLAVANTVHLKIATWGEEKIGKPTDDAINTLRNKFREALSSKTPKKESPETKKTLAEKYGDKNNPEKKEKTPEEVEAERKKAEIESRKKEFLEKATGVEMKGKDLDNWKKLNGVYVGKFFNPSRFKTPKTIDDYPPFERKIYDALVPAYEEAKKLSATDRTKDIKATNKLNLEEFINKLAEQDKLKDLWKPTSNNNS